MPKPFSNELTPRQQVVLDFIGRFIDEKGYGPSIREIGTGCGISSPNGAMTHLKSLKRKGVLKQAKENARGVHRGFMVVGGKSHVSVPFSAEELQRIDQAAAAVGKPTIDFCRDVLVARARSAVKARGSST